MNRLLVSAFLICGMISQAQGERTPFKSILTVAHVAESGIPGEYLYVINGLGAYRTLDALKRGLNHYPKGSTLSWRPSCIRFGDEPELESALYRKGFKAYCDSIGTEFIIEPSG